MKFVKLGDIVTIKKGKKPLFSESPNKKSVRVLQIDDLRNDNKLKYTDDKTGVLVDEEDVLLAWDGANAGTVGFGKTGYIGSTIAVLKKKNPKDYSTVFIGKFLQSQFEYLRSKATGATIPHIDRKSLDSLKLPIIDFTEQISIAEILTQAENLITQRKESILLLDELLKSTFLEMFGDPSFNQNKFPQGKIRDVVYEVKYGTGKPAEINGIYPYLRMNNITSNGYMDFSNLKYINLEKNEEPKYLVKKGDLLFNRTNSKELVGKTGIYNETSQMAIAGYLIRVRTNEKANPWFLWGYLNSLHGKKTLFSMCKSIVGMANINAQELQEIKIVIPPIELQNQFAAIVEKVETVKSEYQASLTELENMYGVLSQKAFKGKLKVKEYN